MLALSLALGVSLPGATMGALPPETVPGPAATSFVLTGDNRLELISATDPVMLTVTDPVQYAGTYAVAQADLAAGPVNLVPPRVEAAAQVGQSVRYRPGLWAYDTARGPVQIMGQWLRDGVAIAGAIARDHEVQPEDLETTLQVREVVSQIGLTMQTRVSDPVGIARRTLVFSLIGQSNMVGFAPFDGGAPYPEHVDQVARTGRPSGALNGEIVAAQTLLDHHDGAGTFMGLALQFATDYMAANPYDRVILVPDAKGATGFATNHWNRGNAFYESAVSRLNTLLAANPSYEFCGFLWHQGESDAGSAADAADYAGRLDQMIADIRADVTAATSTTPFIVGGMVPAWVAGDANRQTVQAALADTPNRVSGTAFVESSGLVPQADGIHFDAASLRILGSRYFTALEALKAARPSPATGGTWEIDGTVIRAATIPVAPEVNGTLVLEGN